MKRLLRITRQATVVAPSAPTPATSPSSNSPSVANARGASAAAYQLSKAVNEAFREVELDGDLDDSLKGLIHQLDEEASKYDNSKIPDDREDISWNCNRETAQLISVACRCAVASYSPDADIEDTPYCTFRKTHTISPSAAGTTKASTFTVVEPQTGSTKNGFLPVLVIAIRGTASKLDHMVNANAAMTYTTEFIDRDGLNLPQVFAHAGFLYNAEALDKAVKQQIDKYAESHGRGKYHVLFTGHSAGGAVASLLFLRYASNHQSGDAARFSCITFGSPPAFGWPAFSPPSEDLNPDWPHPPSQVAVVLNIINEFDLVTCADTNYIARLGHLLSEFYAPSSKLEEAKSGGEEDTLSHKESENNPSSCGKPEKWVPLTAFPRSDKLWNLPQARFHHIGTNVGFLMRLDGSELGLKTVKLSTSLLQQLLFCRLSVHRKSCYLERVKILEEGQFNDEGGWRTENKN